MGLVKVFGIGSPYGEDAVGWRVVEQLRASRVPSGVTLECLDRPGVRLLSRFESVEAAVLIDAVAGLAPGEVRLLSLDEAAALEQPWTSHSFGLGQTLAMGRILEALPPRIDIIGIGVGDVPDLVQLRPEVADAILRAATAVVEIIANPSPPPE